MIKPVVGQKGKRFKPRIVIARDIKSTTGWSSRGKVEEEPGTEDEPEGGGIDEEGGTEVEAAQRK